MRQLVCIGLLLATRALTAADWPQFLGSARNGTTTGVIAKSWSDNGPKRLWKHPVGAGFSGPVVAGGKLILFHRVENKELIEALDTKDGSALWSHGQATRYRDDFGFDEGPRGTPAVQDGKVVCLGAEARLTCVNLADGKLVWSHDLQAEFSAIKGFFGVACSPLIVGGRVVVSIGGPDGAGVVAFNLSDGKLAWKSVDDECSYSSPVAGKFAGKESLYCLMRSGLFVLEPSSGRVVAEQKWRPSMHASVSAATPLLWENRVFLTASYGAGALLLDVSGGAFKEVWKGDRSLSAHYASPVFKDGYIYGFDGRQEMGPSLVCVNAADGKVVWRKDGFGAGTVTLSADVLIVMLEKGELALVLVTPAKFEELARAQILGSGVRAYPAVADGAFYARDKTSLVKVALVETTR